MATHPKGKNCPDSMIFSKKHGKCIQPDLEAVPEDPNSRSKSSPNLNFPTHKKKGEINKV